MQLKTKLDSKLQNRLTDFERKMLTDFKCKNGINDFIKNISNDKFINGKN